MANEIPGMKRIIDHQFFIQLFFDYVATKKVDYNDEHRKLYVGKVYGKVARIKSLLEMLQVIRIMVAETHPSVTDKTKSKVKISVYLRYHIENYFLRITTYRDLIFHLILTINKWDTNTKPINLKGQLLKLAKNEPGIF